MIYAADRFLRGQRNDAGVLYCIHYDIYSNKAYVFASCVSIFYVFYSQLPSNL